MTIWVERLAGDVSRRQRDAKFHQFLALLAPAAEETILDVGVNDVEYSTSDNFLEQRYSHPEHVVAVSKDRLDGFHRRYPSIKGIVADGRSLPFRDHQFDIVFSNAVLEHVGSRADQVRFVHEAHRVARRGYITTPNRRFPVEVHTRIPLLHLLLPGSVFDAFLRCIGKEWATNGYMNLMSRTEFADVLREGGVRSARIFSNRLLGLPMTFTAVWDE